MSSNAKPLLFALLVTLFLNLPHVVEFQRTGGVSPQLFSDGDEALYLPFAVELGAHSPGELVRSSTALDNSYLPLGFPTPHNLAEFFVGKLAHLADLSPLGLGLALDIVCLFVSYLILFKVFRSIAVSDELSHITATCMLVFPGIFPLTAHLGAQPLSSVLLLPFAPFPCLPILRGVTTQLSYPLFALVLLFAARRGTYRFFVVGALSGLLLYLYFFGWLTACVFVPILLIFDRSRDENAGGEKLLNDLARVIAGAALISFPGLFFLAKTKLGSLPHRELLAKTPLYLPVEIVALILLAVTARFFRIPPRISALLGAAALSELILVNLQRLTGVSLQPYHFAVFYLHPLISALCVLTLIRSLPAHLIKLFSYAMLAILAAVSAVNLFHQKATGPEGASFAELISYLREHTDPAAAVSVLPYSPPFARIDGGLPDTRLMPFWIWALSGRFTAPRYIGRGYTREDLDLRRELLVGRLFSGKTQLTGDCPGTNEPMGDQLSENFSWHRAERRAYCEKAAALRETFSLCVALGELRTDYILVEPDLGPVNISDTELTKVWQSSDGKYLLFRVETERMLQNNCEVYASANG